MYWSNQHKTRNYFEIKTGTSIKRSVFLRCRFAPVLILLRTNNRNLNRHLEKTQRFFEVPICCYTKYCYVRTFCFDIFFLRTAKTEFFSVPITSKYFIRVTIFFETFHSCHDFFGAFHSCNELFLRTGKTKHFKPLQILRKSGETFFFQQRKIENMFGTETNGDFTFVNNSSCTDTDREIH